MIPFVSAMPGIVTSVATTAYPTVITAYPATYATATGSAPNRTITFQNTAQAGDIIVIFISHRNWGSASSAPFTPPADYTVAHNYTTSNVRVAAFYKVADGGETSVSFELPSSDPDAGYTTFYQEYLIRGCTGVARTYTAGSGSSPNSPSLTCDWGETDHTLFISQHFGAAYDVGSLPSGYSNKLEMRVQNYYSIRSGRRTLQTNTTDPGAWSVGTAGGSAWRAGTWGFRGT